MYYDKVRGKVLRPPQGAVSQIKSIKVLILQDHKMSCSFLSPFGHVSRRRFRSACASDPSLAAFWIAKDAKFLHADND